MTKPTKPVKPTKAVLKRKLVEMEAQLAHTYFFAEQGLKKAGSSLHASGVLITMHALGGHELIPPVVIKDGLSDETIACLRKDLLCSYEKAIQLKPVGGQ